MGLQLIHYIIMPLSILLMAGCGQGGQQECPDTDQQPVARVFDEHLYQKDVAKLVTEDMAPQDSVEVVSNYINNWVRRRLFLREAEDQLPEEDKAGIEKKIEDYRESLINYQYEKQLVEQELDTTVQHEELTAYYSNNKDNFELRQDIVKVRFVKVMQNAPDIEQAKRWMKRNTKSARSQLESYCYQYAEQFMLNDTSWHRFPKLAQWLPMTLAELEAEKEEGAFIETTGNSHFYLLHIVEMKNKNTTAPFSFVKDKIKKVVLNKRKVELIQQKHNEVYAKGRENGRFEIY